jgi:hypothetical protein
MAGSGTCELARAAHEVDGGDPPGVHRERDDRHLVVLAPDHQPGRIYVNQGAMTSRVTQETVNGMSQAKIGRAQRFVIAARGACP